MSNCSQAGCQSPRPPFFTGDRPPKVVLLVRHGQSEWNVLGAALEPRQPIGCHGRRFSGNFRRRRSCLQGCPLMPGWPGFAATPKAQEAKTDDTDRRHTGGLLDPPPKAKPVPGFYSEHPWGVVGQRPRYGFRREALGNSFGKSLRRPDFGWRPPGGGGAPGRMVVTPGS